MFRLFVSEGKKEVLYLQPVSASSTHCDWSFVTGYCNAVQYNRRVVIYVCTVECVCILAVLPKTYVIVVGCSRCPDQRARPIELFVRLLHVLCAFTVLPSCFSAIFVNASQLVPKRRKKFTCTSAISSPCLGIPSTA